MLGAYFDESGDPDTHGFLTVSGYISNVQRWTLWETSWKRFLDKYRIKALHMKEFDNLIPPSLRSEAMEEISQIIQFHVLRGFAVSVAQDQYTGLTDPRFMSYMGTPYTACTQKCIGMAIEWVERNRVNPGEPITFVFDKGHRNQRQARLEMDKILKTSIGRKRPLDTFAFADPAAVVPIQAADVLAYGVTQRWRRKPFSILDGVERSVKHERFHFYPDRISKLFDEYRRLRRKPWRKK